MAEKEGTGKRRDSSTTSRQAAHPQHPANDNPGDELTGILAERVQNLSEAIEEIDDALTRRKALSKKFVEQIDREMTEIHRQLGHLQPEWKTGFYPKIEFLRLSLHKSLTSRRKDIRSEELKYWKDVVDLLKEKRKFLDEYKSLLSAKKRLGE